MGKNLVNVNKTETEFFLSLQGLSEKFKQKAVISEKIINQIIFFFSIRHFRFPKTALNSACFFSATLFKPLENCNNSKFSFFSASKAYLSDSNQYFLIASSKDNFFKFN